MIVVLVLGGGGWLIGQQLVSSPRTPRAATRRASTPAGVTAFQAIPSTLFPLLLGQASAPSSVSLTAYRDPAGGFTGSYPSSWQRLPSTEPGTILLAASSDYSASLLVRKTQISTVINASNLGAAKKLTDRLVSSAMKVSLLQQPQQTVLGGLPGYLYLYTFDDPTTGEQTAHAHYFLFQGKTLITLVFQALPATRITSLAPLFDGIANKFRASPS